MKTCITVVSLRLPSRGREQFLASSFDLSLLNPTASSCRLVFIALCVPMLDGAGGFPSNRGLGIKYQFQVFFCRGSGSHRHPGDILKAILSYAERMSMMTVLSLRCVSHRRKAQVAAATALSPRRGAAHSVERDARLSGL